MLTLQKPDLVEQLKQIATAQQTTAEDLLTEVVSNYLSNMAEQKIKKESAAFEKLHPQLINTHLNKYVAIHQANVIDYDENLRTLHLRIRKKFGRTPILLRKVTEHLVLPDLVFRSPKLDPSPSTIIRWS